MKSAFTYLEALLVLIIVSIVVTISYPVLQDDKLELARDELISQMKYISYLAILQDNVNLTDIDHRGKLWQIRFHHQVDKEAVIAYTILKDKDGDSEFDNGEYLQDLLINKEIRSVKIGDKRLKNKSTFLNQMYGIDGFTINEECVKNNSAKFLFDKFGHVYINYHKPKFLKGTGLFVSSLVAPTVSTCTISLFKNHTKQNEKKVDICIDTKTGYIYKC